MRTFTDAHRILVVDDEPAIRMLYDQILGNDSQPADAPAADQTLFQVSLAAQGQEAVELSRTAIDAGEPYDVAFLDMRMPPGWDGMETAIKLRELDEKIHLVIVTGHSDRPLDNIQSTFSHNILLLKKPFSTEEILQLARNACKSRSLEMRLERAQQQLMHKDRLMALGEMSTSVAHEINQPLAFIRGLSEHLELSIERGSLNLEKLPEIVGKIIGGVDRISEIIHHIREFARTGKDSAIVFYPIDPVVAVERAIRFFTAKFYSHNIDFQFSADPNMPEILGDHGLLEQVIVNLLSNAYHAVSDRLENDSISVSVCCVGEQVEIRVEDNGMGMDEVTRLHALEPFYTRRDDGTGLGLSIVYGIVRDFKGEVSIDSTLNIGTTITLCFPVVRRNA